MQRVIIDTNVLVSALIQKSYPYLIINELLLEKKIEVLVSESLLKEYYEVLNRKKFAQYPDFLAKAQFLLADLESRSVKVNPTRKTKLLDDVDDNMLLDLAAESKASFLITGNTNDFIIQRFKRTRIVTPKEYWEKYHPKL